MSVPLPGPSDNLRTHGVLSDSLRLNWSAPASASAVPVLGYQVSAQAGGTSGFAVVVVDTGSAATQAHVRGLHPGCWCAALTAHAPARTRTHPARAGCELCTDTRVHPPRYRHICVRFDTLTLPRAVQGLLSSLIPYLPTYVARVFCGFGRRYHLPCC